MSGLRSGFGIGAGRRAAAFLAAAALAVTGLAVTGLAPTAAANPVPAALAPPMPASSTAWATASANAPAPGAAHAPEATGAADSGCPWVGSSEPTEQKVADLLAQMTSDEKISMVHGSAAGAYTGLIAAIPRLCIPALKL